VGQPKLDAKHCTAYYGLMTVFHLKTPTLDNQWRSIILFGQNVASYKFALAKTLLHHADNGETGLSLSDLAPTYSGHICDHLNNADKQSTSPRSRFLDTCRKFNSGEILQDQLNQETARLGFVNVIDAFHVVDGGDIGVRFFEDNRKGGGGIILTDNIFQLRETLQGGSLDLEVEARWRLVETAWDLGVSRNLLNVRADNDAGMFFVENKRRINITSSRDALNGYQKGLCFYCFGPIRISPDHPNLADVDHFFPWRLKRDGFMPDADGIWNLVLACRGCNRGENGKFAHVPSLQHLERLHRRNSYLIDSHHPLRQTLMMQTGRTNEDGARFLQTRHDTASAAGLHPWDPPPKGPTEF
jgi:hypothetical protein